MIFDNSFSKLDSMTITKVLSNLYTNYPNTTMIFTTHKLEVKKYVDKIIKKYGDYTDSQLVDITHKKILHGIKHL